MPLLGHYSFVAKTKSQLRRELEQRRGEVLKLDVGCGANKEAGFIGLDKENLKGVDVVHDFNKAPWPFPDETFTLLSAGYSLSYAEDFYDFFNEAWRVLKVDGQFRLVVPYGVNTKYLTDPRHKTPVVPQTFWSLDPTKQLFYHASKPKPWVILNQIWAPDGVLEMLLAKRPEDGK